MSGRLTAWLVLATAVGTAALIIGFGGSAETTQDPAGGFPPATESARVSTLRKQLPSGAAPRSAWTNAFSTWMAGKMPAAVAAKADPSHPGRHDHPGEDPVTTATIAAPPKQARRAAAAAPTVEELAATVAHLSTQVGELRQAAQERERDTGAQETKYDTLEQWLRDYLSPTFPRPVGEIGMQRWQWCERWWDHDEAVTRFMALWYGWEAARLEVTGMFGLAA